MRFRSFRSILDECLTAIQRGESVEACLARYPRQAARLKPLLTLAERVRRTPAAQPRPWAQATAWNAVRLRAADLRAGRRRAGASFHVSIGWLKPVAVTLALFFALGAMGGATAFASQDALPNDRLYPVKLLGEDVHVWLTFDETRKAEILLDQSDQRMEEINTLVSHGEMIPENVLSALENRNSRAISILEDRPEETVLWSRALTQAGEQERILLNLWDNVESDARVEYTKAVADVHNTQLLGTEAAVAAIDPEDLAGGIRTISGTVESTESGEWTVGGVAIRVDSRTLGIQGVTPGSTVTFKAGRGLGGRLYALTASLIQAGTLPTEAVVYGQVEEVRDDAVRMNGEWYRITADSVLKTRLQIGQTVSVTVKKTDAGPQVSSAEAVSADRESSTLIVEGNIEGGRPTQSEEWTIGGLTFTETSSTQLDLTGGAAVEGARALVEAIKQGDRLMAQRITVLSTESKGASVYLAGRFEGVRGGAWYVSGISLEARSGLQAPEPGSLIAVDADADGGVLRIKQISVIQSPDSPALSRFTGTVVSIDNTIWTTQAGEIRVASRTSTVSGKPLQGARAIIWYRPGTDGVREATYVHVLDENPVVPPAEATPAPTEGE